MYNVRFWVLLGAVVVALMAGCTMQEGIFGQTAPNEVLALVNAPRAPTGGDIIHVQRIYEELEGFSPNANRPQFTRTTTDLWGEMTEPGRYSVTTLVEPGGLIYAEGWDGEKRWEYNVETNPLHALMHTPGENELLSISLYLSSFANPYPDLLAQAQQSPDRLRDLGTEEIAPWGTVRVIAYEWDGVTAQTERYVDRPHTFLFKITEDENWIVEWLDVIHAEEGDVTHRHYQLTIWESIELSDAEADLWTFVPPKGIMLVESLPEATPTVAPELPAQETRTIGDWMVPDYGYAPWLPTYLPEGATLASVKSVTGRGYVLRYKSDDRRVLFMHQQPNLSYMWGSAPETIHLSWAAVELGAGDPTGPPSWKACVKPYEGNVNVILILDMPSRDTLLKIVESLQPVPK